MRKFLPLLLLALVLTACVAESAVAPSNSLAQSLVALPDEARLLILSLVTAGVTLLLLQIGTWLKQDLGQYIQPIVAIVAPILITIIEGYLQMIPPAFDNIALTVIHLLVLLIGSVGTVLIINRVRRKETKQLLA